MAAVLLAIRFSLRCRMHMDPPDTSVRMDTESWRSVVQRNIAEHGYAHIVGLLNRSEVEQLRSLAQNYCYGDVRKAKPLAYGGYSVPAFLDIPEFSGAKWLVNDARLHSLLAGVFNGTEYRFASHNDVGCDFVGVWHKDVLRGNVRKYQECDVWSPDEHGERHDIVKVMFYLQDHLYDDQAMKVIPGSHVLDRTPWDTGYTALHPQMGDAVVFDQRLSHAGNTYYNPFGPGRLFMQVGFGKKNRFTDEFERGTVERQKTLQAAMLKSSTPRGFSTFLADIKFSLLGSVMTALPPKLLNHFSDKDVQSHIAHSCGRGRHPVHGQQKSDL